MGEWKLRDINKEILDKAMGYKNNVPYRVSGRWIFYRLLQDGYYKKKGDYKNKYHPIIDKARKEFRFGWHPYSLSDDTREMKLYGWGALNEDDVTIDDAIILDKFKGQDYFTIICFEAMAMCQQFEYYTTGIPLVPFKGQASIPYKWEIAKLFEEAKEKYDLPMKLLYFGDCDKWGRIIMNAAMKDITRWCDADFEVIHVGLHEKQAIEMGISENPEREGEYQWEALSDKQARSIIEPVINKYQNQDVLLDTMNREKELIKSIKEKLAK